MIFPEGTRVKAGKDVKAKGGAVLLSHRTGAPILPVYISPRTTLFCPVYCVIGRPEMPEFSSDKPGEEEILKAAEDIMQRTYLLRDMK